MTEKEPMSCARNDIMRAAEAALKAYDQGVEDGARQERERIREALLSDEAVNAAEVGYINTDVRDFGYYDTQDGNWDHSGYESSAHRNALEAAMDHIGLGAVTTEESENHE